MKREHEFTGDVVEQECEGCTWLEVWNEDRQCYLQSALIEFGTPARGTWESFKGRRVRVTLTIEDAPDE